MLGGWSLLFSLALGIPLGAVAAWRRNSWLDSSAMFLAISGVSLPTGGRGASTAIYYLLREGEVSAWHRVDADEVWHHYDGDPLELAQNLRSVFQKHLKGQMGTTGATFVRFGSFEGLAARYREGLGREELMASFGVGRAVHYAYAYTSGDTPFPSAAVLVMDGVGEWATTTYGKGKGAAIERIGTVEFPHSLGLLYSTLTSYLGFKVNDGEYKVMGLAPYGEPRFRDRILGELVDLKDWDLPFYPFANPPAAGKYSDPLQIRWAEKVASADGYILICPEYNHGPPAVLKNALDFVYAEWNRKPVTFVGYGGNGGARSIELLTCITRELQMAPLEASVHIMGVWGKVKDEVFTGDDKDLRWTGHLFDELEWWGNALRTAREA